MYRIDRFHTSRNTAIHIDQDVRRLCDRYRCEGFPLLNVLTTLIIGIRGMFIVQNVWPLPCQFGSLIVSVKLAWLALPITRRFWNIYKLEYSNILLAIQLATVLQCGILNQNYSKTPYNSMRISQCNIILWLHNVLYLLATCFLQSWNRLNNSRFQDCGFHGNYQRAVSFPIRIRSWTWSFASISNRIVNERWSSHGLLKQQWSRYTRIIPHPFLNAHHNTIRMCLFHFFSVSSPLFIYRRWQGSQGKRQRSCSAEKVFMKKHIQATLTPTITRRPAPW